MDRGFGGRNLSQRDDRIYDDFYSDRGRSGGGSFRNSRGGGGAARNGREGQWGGGRDRGFFGQGQGAGRDRDGQMLETLKQQQHLLSAFMTSQSRGGGMQMNRNDRGRYQGSQRNAYRGPRPGDKRRNETSAANIKKKKPATPTRKEPKKVSPPKEEEIDIPDDEVEVPDSLMDSVEKLRQRKEVERNVADEDVEKLVVFGFTGKGYMCKTCGTLLNNKQSFTNHLMGKSHVMKVIDARTAKTYQDTRDLLDIDLSPDDWYENSEKARSIILKQAKLTMKAKREKELQEKLNYNKNPSNFFTVTLETRKTAVKKGNCVTITSLVESQMEVKDFVGDKFFGCEFVKAVSGFHCRLCDMYIKDAAKVVPHINDRVHHVNYSAHLRKTTNYEKQQKEQNVDLAAILAEEEEKVILLSQTPGAATTSPFLSQLADSLVLIPKLLNPPEKKKEEAAEKKEDDKEVEKKEGEADDDKEKSEEKAEGGEEEAKEEETKEAEEGGDKEEEAEATKEEIVEEDKEEEKMEEEIVEEPEKNEEKKPTAAKKAPLTPKLRGGMAKRGRGGRGGKASPAPKRGGRRGAAEDPVEIVDEDEASADAESFQVVDDIADAE